MATLSVPVSSFSDIQNHHSKVMLCAVTLDNADSPALTGAVKELPWPKQEEFYMVKQFIVVK